MAFFYEIEICFIGLGFASSFLGIIILRIPSSYAHDERAPGYERCHDAPFFVRQRGSHCGNLNKIKIVKQSNPGYASQEMYPTLEKN